MAAIAKANSSKTAAVAVLPPMPADAGTAVAKVAAGALLGAYESIRWVGTKGATGACLAGWSCCFRVASAGGPQHGLGVLHACMAAA